MENSIEESRLRLAGLASKCTTCTVIEKELLEDAAAAIQCLEKRIHELEQAKADPLTEPHGDLIDREPLMAELMLDTSVEVMARTKIINEYITYALENAPVVVPSTRKTRNYDERKT